MVDDCWWLVIVDVCQFMAVLVGYFHKSRQLRQCGYSANLERHWINWQAFCINVPCFAALCLQYHDSISSTLTRSFMELLKMRSEMQ